MTTSEILSSAWASVEDEIGGAPGVYSRRIFSQAAVTIFAAVEAPSRKRRVQIVVNKLIENLPSITLRGVSVSTEIREARETKVFIQLEQSSFTELFTTLCADLINKILPASDEAALRQLWNRLNYWQKFLQAAGPSGLTNEQQSGLYAELLFLKDLIARSSSERAVRHWVGPLAANHDFQISNIAVEVKSTTSNNVDTLTIANEYQLDNLNLRSLFLLHVCFERRENLTTTLPTLVSEIQAICTADAARELDDKLISAGYHEMHRTMYENVGYVERRRTYYEVNEGFPRVIANELKAGVSEVSYKINTSGCGYFQVTAARVLDSVTREEK